MANNTFIKAALTEQEHSEIDEEIRSHIKKLSHCVEELKRKKIQFMSEERSKEEMDEFNAAMEVRNRHQDFVEKKLNDFRVQYDISDRNLELSINVKVVEEQKMLKNEVDQDLEKKQIGDDRSKDLDDSSSSDHFDEIKDLDSEGFKTKLASFGEFGRKGGEKFTKIEFDEVKKLNLVKMRKGLLDQSDDHIHVEALTTSNVAVDGFKNEGRENGAMKKTVNVKRDESYYGFDDLEFSGQLEGIEKNTIGLVGVNGKCEQNCTSMAVEIEGFEEEEQVDDVDKMFNPRLRESHQSDSITDLEVSTKKRVLERDMNNLTHEKDKFAKKLKKEEEADEEKTNDKQRNSTLKVISDRVAELEIDLSSLQVDVVCLMSEKENAVIKLQQSSSELENSKNGIGASKITNIAANGKLEALKVISDHAAKLEIDLFGMQVDIVLLMSEIEKAVAKFRKLSSELEKLKWDNFEKKLEAVNLVRKETIDLMEPTHDLVTVHKIDPLIKRCSDQSMEKTNGKRVKLLERTDTEKTQLQNSFEDPENGIGELEVMNGVAIGDNSSDAEKEPKVHHSR